MVARRPWTILTLPQMDSLMRVKLLEAGLTVGIAHHLWRTSSSSTAFSCRTGPFVQRYSSGTSGRCNDNNPCLDADVILLSCDCKLLSCVHGVRDKRSNVKHKKLLVEKYMLFTVYLKVYSEWLSSHFRKKLKFSRVYKGFYTFMYIYPYRQLGYGITIRMISVEDTWFAVSHKATTANYAFQQPLRKWTQCVASNYYSLPR